MKTITDRHRSIVHIRGVNHRCSRPVAKALGDLLTPKLRAGEHLPDLELVQDLVVRALDDGWGRLSSADELWIDARDHQAELIARRSTATATLYREMGRLRALLKGLFGADLASRWIGFSGETSRDPVVLLRQTDRTLARLRNKTPLLPWDTEPPSTADRKRGLAAVASAVEILRPLVPQALEAVKLTDAARLGRKRALKDFNACFVEMAGWLAATYRMIGRDDLATEVLPSGWRKGQTHKVAKQRRPTETATERETNTRVSQESKERPHQPGHSIFGWLGTRRRAL